ncbi:MAG: glycosyltransferase [Clostridium sp.]|jgi:glycosyltransferase involved in cell wall biosynthesis|nr:glycosyltransferase [Clostridium sp.]
MDNRKNVLFVINTLGRAGAETALLELLRRLEPQDWRISLYVLTGQGELSRRLPPFVTLLNKRYCDRSVLTKEGKRQLYRTVLRSALAHASLPRNLPYLLGNLAAMIRKGRIWPEKLFWRILSDAAPRFPDTYDLAVAFVEGGSAYYVADHVKAAKKAVFLHIDYIRAGYTPKLDRGCYGIYDSVFCVSADTREHFLEAYPEYEKKSKIFHILIDPETVRRRAGEPGGFADGFEDGGRGLRILTVGRLTFQKSYDCAIAAMKLLKEEGYPVRWYALGEGELRQDLEKQIRKAGLEEDFLLLGAAANPYPYYAQADIYVHASRFEGRSVAIIEAQILGCPVIASDCGGNRENVTDGEDGLLCELQPKRLKESIVSLISDPQKRKRLGEAAARKSAAQGGELRLLTKMAEEA